VADYCRYQAADEAQPADPHVDHAAFRLGTPQRLNLTPQGRFMACSHALNGRLSSPPLPSLPDGLVQEESPRQRPRLSTKREPGEGHPARRLITSLVTYGGSIVADRGRTVTETLQVCRCPAGSGRGSEEGATPGSGEASEP
jgi:hypothetical protein